MKIIVVTKNYGDGFTGATSATYNLIKRWIDEDVEVEVLTLNIVGGKNQVAVSVKKNIIQIIMELKKQKYGFIGYSDDHLGFIFKLAGIKYLHTYHGNWPDAMFINGVVGFVKGLWFVPLYAITLLYSSYIINVSQYMKKFTDKFNRKSKVIYNGSNTRKNHINAQIKFNSIDHKTMRILMVGGIDKRKYSSLINLLSQMRNDDKKHFIFDIYGAVHDTSVSGDLCKFKNVSVKGFKNVIPYDKYDILVSTSSSENLPISIVESIQSGTPVFTFDVGGINEVVSNLNTGILVNDKSIEILLDELNKFYDGSTIIRFSNNAIIKKFSWDKASEQYLKCFKEVN